MNTSLVRIALWAVAGAVAAVANVGHRHAMAEAPSGLFINPMSLGSVNDPVEGDIEPHVSTDGLTLYFTSTRSGDFHIYKATRSDQNEPFGDVMRLDFGDSRQAGPFISPDGSKLYFYDNRNQDNRSDLFVATMSTPGGVFDVVTNLEDVNSPNSDAGPHLSNDGRRLYFSSWRPGTEGRFDLFVATRNDHNEPFTTVESLGSDINSPYDDHDPSLSSDELTIFFSGLPTGFGDDRPDGKGEGDIWVATRDSIDEEFGEAVNLDDFGLGSEVNTSFFDAMPYISREWPAVGSKLYFSTFRDGVSAELWQATWIPATTGDFSGDGNVDTTDVDMLVREIVAGAHEIWFDVNRDSVVNATDLDPWLLDAARHNGLSQAYLKGDANLDGSVDSADLNELALSWRQDVAHWSAGDFNADGIVNSADLNALALNWQRSVAMTSPASQIPEPSSFLLAVVGLALVWRGGFSRKRLEGQ